MTVVNKVVREFATGVRKKTEFVRKEESLRRCGERVEQDLVGKRHCLV